MIASIRGLTVRYGNRVAVDNLQLDLMEGEIALLLGPNGAGKSTTLAAMAGAVMPSQGVITVEDQDLASGPRSVRAKVGFADQPPALYDFFSAEEHVRFIAEARGSDPASSLEMLDKLGLANVAHRPCRELSFGMRQRVGLAAALVGPVKLILLDETLNGLDPHASRSARTTLRQVADRGAAILMSTHLLGVAERMCDRILVMDKGKLVADKRRDEVAELVASGPTAIEDLYLSLISEEDPA